MQAVKRINTLGKRAPDGAWTIPIVGDVGAPGFSSEDLLRELIWARPDTIRFIINSPGGLVYDAIAVAGWVREQGIEVYAEIYGLCMSAATVFAALAGPKRTSMAPGSMFLVHAPYGGDEKAIDNAKSFLVDLYASAYGWSKTEAKRHIEAEDGEGVLWTAAEAKKIGVVGEIMEVSAVAAKYNPNPDTMTEPKKITAKVKLSTMDAIRAAVGEGATVEVDVDAAAAAAIAEKEATIAALTKEVEDLKAAQGNISEKDEEVAKAKDELDTQAKSHAKALEDLKAAHAKEISDLKKPLAKGTVHDNTEGPKGTDKADPSVSSVKAQFFKGMTPVAKARYEMAIKEKAEQTADK